MQIGHNRLSVAGDQMRRDLSVHWFLRTGCGYIYRVFRIVIFTVVLSHSVSAQENPHKAPLYWSVYENHILRPDDFSNYITESDFRANIDWVEQNLLPFGYSMIAIDGWGDDTKFDENGYRLTHSRFWQHDYAWWADHLQSRGMNLGMYNNPLWVNRQAVSAGAKIKGTDIPLADIIDTDEESLWFTWVQVDRPGAEEYVKGYIEFYAQMGIKYLRVDFLSWFEDGFDKNFGRVGPQRPREHYETALRWMREAVDEHGMFLSLVMPHLKNEGELEVKYGHMIRINEDVGTGGWQRFSSYQRGIRRTWWSQWANTFDGFVYWSRLSGRGKLILDGDFIRINTMDNDDQKKSVISLHLMAGGPLSPADQHDTIGSDLWLYQNTELLELNRDGFVGKPLDNDPVRPLSQIWVGEMSNGDWIVGLFNREINARERSIDFASQMGISEPVHVRDLWKHEDLGLMTSYTTMVPSRGVVMLRLSRPIIEQVETPEMSPGSGLYSEKVTVSLSTSTGGAQIYYTMDGSIPLRTSLVYEKPVDISETTNLKAIAVKEGMDDSEVAEAEYVITKSGDQMEGVQVALFPNPFNNETKIRIVLEKQGPVSLRVYDLLGREVAVLVQKEVSEGVHEFQFNGNNLAPGLYIYQLVHGSMRTNGTMTLLR